MRKLSYSILFFLIFLLLVASSTQAGEVWSHYEPGNCLFGGDILVKNQCQVFGSTPFILEGSTINDFETSVSLVDPTADRIITLPNASGTVLLDADIANQALLGASPLVFEGATEDGNVTTLSVANPTSDLTIALPNDSGNVILGDAPVKVLSVLQANLAIASIAAQTCSDVAVTVTGAAVGDAINIGPPASLEANLSVCGFVSAANTTQIRICNPTASAIDPADTNSWRVTVFHY